MGDVVEFPERKAEATGELPVAFTVEMVDGSPMITVHEQWPSAERQNEIERMLIRGLVTLWGERRGGAVALFLMAREGTALTWVQPDHLETEEQRAWLARRTADCLEEALREETADGPSDGS